MSYIYLDWLHRCVVAWTISCLTHDVVADINPVDADINPVMHLSGRHGQQLHWQPAKQLDILWKFHDFS